MNSNPIEDFSKAKALVHMRTGRPAAAITVLKDLAVVLRVHPDILDRCSVGINTVKVFGEHGEVVVSAEYYGDIRNGRGDILAVVFDVPVVQVSTCLAVGVGAVPVAVVYNDLMLVEMTFDEHGVTQ